MVPRYNMPANTSAAEIPMETHHNLSFMFAIYFFVANKLTLDSHISPWKPSKYKTKK